MGHSTLDYHEYRFPCGPEDCSESVTCWNDTSKWPLLNSPISERDLSPNFDSQLECETIDGKGKTIFQKRMYNKPSVDFNKDWHEYERGFGSDGNFWIGLNRIHRLSSKGRNILTISADNQTSINYSGFWVDDASSRYTMHAGPKHNKGYDPLETSKGRPFTVPDGGIDGCANEFTSGWWFGRRCRLIDINLNGRHNSTGWNKIFMQYWHVKTCRMTIQRTFIQCDKTCPNGGTCRKSGTADSYLCDCQPRYTGRRCEVSLEDTTVATVHTTTVHTTMVHTTMVHTTTVHTATGTSPTTHSPVDVYDLFLYVYLPVFLSIVFIIGMSALITRKCVQWKKKEIKLKTGEESPLVRTSKRQKKRRRFKQK